jgi:hypothetical protein
MSDAGLVICFFGAFAIGAVYGWLLRDWWGR